MIYEIILFPNKSITIYQELYFDLAKLVKEEPVRTKEPTGFLNLRTRDLIKKRIVVDESKRKEYDYFINSIIKRGIQDGMKISPVIYSRKEDIEYPIPTPIIGIYIVGYKFCLKCTIEF